MLVGSPLVVALQHVDAAEAGQRVGFGATVGGVLGGAQGLGVDAAGGGVLAAGVEEAEQRGSEARGVLRPAISGRVSGDGSEGGQFGIQPGARCGFGLACSGSKRLRVQDGIDAREGH